MLEEQGIRVELDDRNEKIGYKIREAAMMKIPYLIIVGDGEVENKTISVRARGNRSMSDLSLDEFIKMIKEEIDTKKL